MTFSVDLRWRAIVLVYVYNIDRSTVSSVLGVSARSLERWYTQFRKTGNVSSERKNKNKTSRWPPDVCNFVKKYVTANPCFYFEELREELRASFSDLLNISDSSIYRALRFDLGLTRKVLAKRDSESIPRERREYVQRLLPYYCGPDQLVFVDETSKDARSELRKYGWSARNTPAYASLPFSRGSRVSVLAALDVTGFFSWGHVEDTFTRQKFRDTFKSKVLPFLNPWPHPRSILVMDNAKIHMYKELQELVDTTGALLFFLPPYSPDRNPIEVAFSLLKRWIQRHGVAAFRQECTQSRYVLMYSQARIGRRKSLSSSWIWFYRAFD